MANQFLLVGFWSNFLLILKPIPKDNNICRDRITNEYISLSLNSNMPLTFPRIYIVTAASKDRTVNDDFSARFNTNNFWPLKIISSRTDTGRDHMVNAYF
jgi:hypothetical protein